MNDNEIIKHIMVLIVDDDEDDYIIVRNLLKKAEDKYQVDWASSYEDGLKKLQNCSYDICFVDYRLGQRNGLEFLFEEIVVKIDLPIVLLTGQGASDVDLEAMEKGACDYLNKNELSNDSLEHSLRYSIYRKQTERNLKEMNSNMNRFVGIVAHDLRNPLGIILGYCELLQSYVEGQIGLEILNDMRSLSENAINLVNDILVLSAVKGGVIKIEQGIFNLADTVASALETTSFFANRKNIALIQDLCELNSIYGDEKRVLQVLVNLINNAIKFTHVGGKVIIRSSVVGDDSLKIEVIDNGIGIENSDLEKIFDRSVPFSTYGTEGEKGTGYGLPLCQELIKGHGSIIEVASSVSKGSNFHFTLPLAKI